MNSGDHGEIRHDIVQPVSSGPATPAPTPGAEVPRCPQCGSIRVRSRARPLLFNGIACAVTLALTPVFCIMALGVLASFLALPITAAVAAVGRNRCRDCGCRFAPGGQTGVTAAGFRFPWALHVSNIVELFLLCIVGPHVLRRLAGAEDLPDAVPSMGLFFTFGFLLWASLVYHLILYHALKRRLASPLIWAVLFILPGAVVGATILHATSPKLRMQGLLNYARLAPLPESASGVRFYSWSSPFSGEDFVRFTADPNDVERFVADSPALQGQEPVRFSAQHMRLAYPEDYGRELVPLETGHEYFTPRHSAPGWYKQEIRGPARKYMVQPPRYQLPGEVLVDEETSTVYIHLWFS